MHTPLSHGTVPFQRAGCRPASLLHRLWVVLAAGLLLVGCAYPTQFKPGDSVQAVQAKLGAPFSVVKTDDGGERWLYSTQPMGREAFQLRFGANGQLQSTTQVLTAENFGAIRNGQYTERQLLQDFGPPMEVTQVYSFKGRVFTYRFWDNSIKRFAHVHIDRQGVVQRLMFMDEPTPELRQRD